MKDLGMKKYLAIGGIILLLGLLGFVGMNYYSTTGDGVDTGCFFKPLTVDGQEVTLEEYYNQRQDYLEKQNITSFDELQQRTENAESLKIKNGHIHERLCVKKVPLNGDNQ